MDPRRIADGSEATGPLELMPLDIYDPAERTTTTPTWREAISGELVMLIGYPRQGGFALGAASVARVFTDAEAYEAIDTLKASGDQEGGIPYEPDVEFLAKGGALAGMSGGGAFGRNGELLGVVVRGSADTSDQVVRVVRISHVIAELLATLESASLSKRAELEPFLNAELAW